MGLFKIVRKEFSTESEGWREVAQMAGRWLRWVEDGTGAFMRKLHDVEGHTG